MRKNDRKKAALSFLRISSSESFLLCISVLVTLLKWREKKSVSENSKSLYSSGLMFFCICKIGVAQ